MDWKNRINSSPRPFNLVNTNLQQMGCISLDRFLSSSSDADFEDIHYIEVKPATVTQTPLPLPQISIPIEQPSDASSEPQSSAVKMQNVARLHQACQRAFGGSEGLKFDYIQENGSQSKQCILTITRSNGSVRSYKTEPTFTRKNDAKAHAANIAVELGALEFITTGDSDALKQKKGLLLSPLDVADPESQEKEEVAVELPVDDGPVRRIESCCIEWRAGIVKPFWVEYQESKNGKSFGAALRIQLTPHSSRVYSTDAAFGSALEAKIVCANVALQEGVLDYIKYGNGQTNPAPSPVIAQDGRVPEPPPRPTSVISLQAFYESLPQPFPEPVADKTASEINGPAWLNTLLQSARGARLKSKFIWIMDTTQGLHGCVLRLDRPDAECKSYFVDPRFHKRADAKAAVCLLAMSQDIGNYIRHVGLEVENKISEHARKLANQAIYPGIIAEYHKIRSNGHPEYSFYKDGDAFGCTLAVDLSSSPEKPDLTTYSVKPEYRNKVDAKVAVATLAAEQGIFELLRFRGAPPPPGYVSFWESHNRDPVSVSKKRKEPDTRDDGDSNGQKEKKLKLEPAEGHHDFAHNKGARKKPPASGSSGLVPLGAPAQKAGRPGGQRQHGHRSVGHSGALNNPSYFGMTPSPLSHPSFPPAPRAQPGVGAVHTMHYTYQFTPQPIYGAPQHPSGGTGQFMGATAYPQMQPPNVPFYPGYIQAYGTVPPAAPYNPYPHQHQQYRFVAPGGQPHNTHPNIPGPSSTGTSVGYDHPDRPKSMDTSLDYGDGSDGGASGAQEPSHRKKSKKSKGKVKREKVESSGMSEGVSAPTTDAETVSSRDRSLTVESGQILSKSHFDTLKDFCAREKKPQPHFYREAIFGDTGTRYKVWMEMGSERLELSTTFENLDDGKERLSRQVLNRLRRAKETQAA